MSQSTTPADTTLILATNPVESESLMYTVAELRAAMSPVGYMTPADQVNAAAAAAAQATANAAIPASTLGQPLGPIQANASNQISLANLPASVLGSSHFLGTWNASTNTPLIESGVPPLTLLPVGAYYIVSVAGTQEIDGNSVWHAGDWIIWNGTAWNDISGQVNPVSSVAGLQGVVSTAQLATALAGTVGISSASGQLNVTLGTTANTAAAGNDSRITGAAPTAGVYAYLADVAAIASYTGNSPSLRTSGYYAAGDGGGAIYSQTNTGAPAILDGAGRSWYLADIDGAEVNILQFGAKADGLTDMQPAWAAADAFAAASGKAVFIPSSASGNWVLKTPMVATAIWTHGEAADLVSGHGTQIGWHPATITEGVTALTSQPANGAAFLVSDLLINGADKLPVAANIVSSGWLPALATASCTFSGNVMTASGTTGAWAIGQNVSGAPGAMAACTFAGTVMTAGATTGTWAVGQTIDGVNASGTALATCTITSFGTGTGGAGTYNLSISQSITGSVTTTGTGSGPGMTNFCTITGFGTGTGGDGTYILSAVQSISGPIPVTATGYPNLTAFKAGTAGFRAAATGVYRNCRTGNTKYGMVLDTGSGHVFCYNCNWQGFFGVYCRQNGYDFLFDSCQMGGTWCGVLAGTGVVSGTNGGISFRAIRSHIGFSPVGLDILNDGGASNYPGVWEFYGCSFEAVSEAMLRSLPTSGGVQILLDMYPTGSIKTSFQFPSSVIGNPCQYYFYLPGGLSNLKGLSANAANDGPYAISAYPPGSLAVAYIGSLNPNVIGDLDLDLLGPNVVFGTRPYTLRDVRNPDYDRDFLRRRDQIIRPDVLEKGNLLGNPESAANWTAGSSGTTINVVSLSSLTASGGALNGFTIPNQIYRESNNPNVVVITNPAGLPNANLAAVTLSSWNVNRSICLHCWAVSSGSGATGKTSLSLVTNTNGGPGTGQYSRGETYFQEVMLQGERLSDYGATSLSHCNVQGFTSGQTIYLIGLMVSNDRPSAPNPLPGPYAVNGFYVGAENNGLTAAQAPQIIAFQTTPPAGSFPNGSIGINIASTTPVLYHYIGGAWVAGT